MSYDIRLVDKDTGDTLTAAFTPNREGTYCIINGAERRCSFNITYNYADHFYKHIDEDKGIRAIYGMTAKDSIPLLKKAISKLGDDIDPDYWKSTEGNAKEALRGLLIIAEAADPEGVWTGD